MVAVYSKMKPDSFTSQLQTVLTACYEDIMGIHGASGCTKAKVVKRKFEDQEDTVADADADADAANTGGAATPATPEGEEAAEVASGGEGPPPAPSPAGKNGAVKAGAARGGW